MKKLLALLTLVTLLGLAVLPSAAAYNDRAPVKQWCHLYYGGAYEMKLRTVDCTLKPGWTCQPERCLLAP